VPSTTIPSMRYEDAPFMIVRLCAVFGFARQLVVADGKGGLAGARPARADEFGRLRIRRANFMPAWDAAG
jgi:hypothetical protein